MPVFIGQLRSTVIKLNSYKESTERTKKQTGEINAPWTFLEALDCILGHRPTTCPPRILTRLVLVSYQISSNVLKMTTDYIAACNHLC